MYTKYTIPVERVIYHGSEFIIQKPEFGKGNAHNDCGLGFYCCSNKALAKEWAARKSGKGYVNRYKIRDDRLKILDLTKPPYDNVLHWVALLMRNRELSADMKNNYPRELKYLEEKWLIEVKDFDIVIGCRADDSYFRFPEAFVRSEIALESLNKIFRAGELGKQYVLVSERAFRLIRFLDFEKADAEAKDDYYLRKGGADKTFAELLDKDRYSKGTRLRDLVMNHE